MTTNIPQPHSACGRFRRKTPISRLASASSSKRASSEPARRSWPTCQDRWTRALPLAAQLVNPRQFRRAPEFLRRRPPHPSFAPLERARPLPGQASVVPAPAVRGTLRVAETRSSVHGRPRFASDPRGAIRIRLTSIGINNLQSVAGRVVAQLPWRGVLPLFLIYLRADDSCSPRLSGAKKPSNGWCAKALAWRRGASPSPLARLLFAGADLSSLAVRHAKTRTKATARVSFGWARRDRLSVLSPRTRPAESRNPGTAPAASTTSPIFFQHRAFRSCSVRIRAHMVSYWDI